MSKSFVRVLAGLLVLPGAQRTTIVNTGITPISVVDQETDKALEVLEFEESEIVKKALFSIPPGQSQKFGAGSYAVDFHESISASAIAFVEVTSPKETKPKTVKPDENPA